MEQVDSIPFSSFIAGMLLIKESYTLIEIVNKISELSYMGIVVEDENDDFDLISCCVEMDENYGFRLKKGFDYDSVLASDDLVVDFLMLCAGEKVLLFFSINIDEFISKEVCDSFVKMIVGNYSRPIKTGLLFMIKLLKKRSKAGKNEVQVMGEVKKKLEHVSWVVVLL